MSPGGTLPPMSVSESASALPPIARGGARTFSALGNPARMRILNLLATQEKTVSELAREMQLHPSTLRYHLGQLLRQGLIEEVVPVGPRHVGRPATLYRLSRSAHIPGYPQRHFELLGQLALEALGEAVGERSASTYLIERGRKAGRGIIRDFAARARVDRWTPDAFERFVLGGLFRDFGIPTEVLSKSPKRLRYRAFSCPFLEVAERMPDLVCDSLDRGFHRGIDEALGGVRTERLACMGHGAPFCEYVLVWRTAERTTSKRETTPRIRGPRTRGRR